MSRAHRYSPSMEYPGRRYPLWFQNGELVQIKEISVDENNLDRLLRLKLAQGMKLCKEIFWSTAQVLAPRANLLALLT